MLQMVEELGGYALGCKVAVIPENRRLSLATLERPWAAFKLQRAEILMRGPRVHARLFSPHGEE